MHIKILAQLFKDDIYVYNVHNCNVHKCPMFREYFSCAASVHLVFNLATCLCIMEVDAFMEPEMEADTSDIGETYVSNVIAPTD